MRHQDMVNQYLNDNMVKYEPTIIELGYIESNYDTLDVITHPCIDWCKENNIDAMFYIEELEIEMDGGWDVVEGVQLFAAVTDPSEAVLVKLRWYKSI